MYYEDEIDDRQYEEFPLGTDCPKCGYPLVAEGDIAVCYSCGWTEFDEE